MNHGWCRGPQEVLVVLFLLLATRCALAGWTAPSPGQTARLNSMPDVVETIERLTQELLDRHDPHRDWEPARPISGEIQQAHGRTALVLLSLLEVGRSMQEPTLHAALNRLLQSDCDGVYALSLRIMLTARLPERYHPFLRRDVAALLAGFSATVNGWGYRTDPNTTRFDNSTTQFAALALRDAARAGVALPAELWGRLRNRFLATQHRDGSWDYAGEGRPRASMTAAAIATLAIIREALHRDAYDKGGNRLVSNLESAIEAGMTWLDAHFDPSQNVGHTRHLPYYLFAVERAAHATGRVYLKEYSWFHAGAEVVTKRGIRPSTPDLALTLLFLKRGLIPNAIAEIEGDPALHRPLATGELTHRIANKLESKLGWIRIRNPETWHTKTEQLPALILVDLSAHKSLFTATSHPTFQLLLKGIHAGSTVVVSVPRGRGHTRQVADAFAQALPGTTVRAVEKEAPMCTTPWPVRTPPSGSFALHNGVRSVAVVIAGDPIRALQRGGRHADRFSDFLANIWLRAHGGIPPNPSTAPQSSPSNLSTTGTIAHLCPPLRHIPEPHALPTFSMRMERQTGMHVRAVQGILGTTQAQEAWSLAIVSGVEGWKPNDHEWNAIVELLQANIPVIVETTGGQGTFATEFASSCAKERNRPPVNLNALTDIFPGIRDHSKTISFQEVGWTPAALRRFGPGTHAHRLEHIPTETPAPLLIARFDLTHALLNRPAIDVFGWQTPWADALLKHLISEAHHES